MLSEWEDIRPSQARISAKDRIDQIAVNPACLPAGRQFAGRLKLYMERIGKSKQVLQRPNTDSLGETRSGPPGGGDHSAS